jgi:aryl-alcohol dehydrogenase-like predicted oxidoreductase
MTATSAGTITVAGRDVPRLGYGTMRLTGPHIFGPPADRDEAIRVLRRAVDLGVRVIDTSWYYGPYVANEILAEALHPYPEDLVIVSKLGGARGDDASWHAALTADELRAGCEHDLRSLKLDAVPVTHLRWIPTPDTTFDEALGTMLELQAEGKIEHIGLSNIDLPQYDTAVARTPIATVSNAYSVLDRTHDDLVNRVTADGVAFLPFFPLGASPVRSGAGVTGMDAVTDIADRRGATATQVAIAWLLARSPVMVPIPGTSQVAHLEENIASANLTLSPEERAQLDAAR